MFLPWNEMPPFMHLLCQILLGGISLMSAKSFLYFYEEEILIKTWEIK